MASVNFEKFKSVQSAKAQFRHCDKDARKETDHGNKEIDLQKSDMNIQYASSSYESTCKRYDSRIKAIDEGGRNKNRRKDRVTLLGLEVPVPKDLPSSDYVKWFSRVNSIIEGRYGADNVMNAYIHFDEQHEYMDVRTREMTMSRVHGHFFVVPEINGKLNAKELTLRKNMISLNREIEKMTKNEFGVKFMTGEKRKSRDEVEDLKRKSREAEREARMKEREAQLEAREMQVKRLEADVRRQKDALERDRSDFERYKGNFEAERKNAIQGEIERFRGIATKMIEEAKQDIANKTSNLPVNEDAETFMKSRKTKKKDGTVITLWDMYQMQQEQAKQRRSRGSDYLDDMHERIDHAFDDYDKTLQ